MVSKKIGYDLDFDRNSLLNAVIQVLSTDPTPATVGRVYYNSTVGAIMVGNGTSFVQVAAGAGYGDEQAQDAIAAAFAAGSQAGITVNYNDAGNAYSLTITNGSIIDAMISASAAISADKLADGSSKVVMTTAERTKLSGVATGATAYTDTNARANRLDQFAAPTNPVAFNGQRLTGIADAIANSDVPSYGQILALLQGRNDKTVVRTVFTTNVAIASGLVNGATNDGVTLATGDRVAVTANTTASENGIYIVAASGAASRATDADTGAKLKDAFFFVSEGTNQQDTGWKVMNDGAITVGTTNIVISKIIDSALYNFSGGLSKSGSNVTLDTTVAARKYGPITIGDGTATSFTITHNLNNTGAQARVWYTTSTFDEIDVVVRHTSANVLTLLFNTAPTSGQFSVSVIG